MFLFAITTRASHKDTFFVYLYIQLHPNRSAKRLVGLGVFKLLCCQVTDATNFYKFLYTLNKIV